MRMILGLFLSPWALDGQVRIGQTAPKLTLTQIVQGAPRQITREERD